MPGETKPFVRLFFVLLPTIIISVVFISGVVSQFCWFFRPYTLHAQAENTDSEMFIPLTMAALLYTVTVIDLLFIVHV